VLFCSNSLRVRAKRVQEWFTATVSFQGKRSQLNSNYGKITDPLVNFETKVKASHTGIIIGHNIALVKSRDASLPHWDH